MHKLTDDQRLAFPKAVNILKTHLYVDDLLTDAGTIDETRTIRDEIITLLSRNGFTIRHLTMTELSMICCPACYMRISC